MAATMLSAGITEAQDIYDFKGLRSSGELSDDFITTSTDKYMAQADSMLAGRKSKESKVTDDFLLKSNFILDEMLLSGSVLVNDEVGAYVNEVLDSVLIGQPELRKQISVYITKAPEVNDEFAKSLGAFEDLNDLKKAGIPFYKLMAFVGVGKYKEDAQGDFSLRLRKEVIKAAHQQKITCTVGTMYSIDKAAKNNAKIYQAIIQQFGGDILATDSPKAAYEAINAVAPKKSSKLRYYKK
jgi:hypothetical protein